MKNHWIKKSVARKFDRLKRIIEGQWSGLATAHRFKNSFSRDSFIVYVKLDNNISDNLVIIRFDRLDAWTIEYRTHTETGSPYFRIRSLPRYEDPVFLSRIEEIINRAVNVWKAQKERDSKRRKNAKHPLHHDS